MPNRRSRRWRVRQRWRVAVMALAVVTGLGGDGWAQAAREDEGMRWALYGFFKTDASFDSAPIDPGNFARWVDSPGRTEVHSHFNLTVRETRLGIDVQRASEESPRIGGKLEVDFYGGGLENKNALKLRHAFLEVRWTSGWKVLAGQTDDVISPLLPRTVNYGKGRWVGNIGYRRPQVRVTRIIGDERERALVLDAAASRTIGDDFATEPGDTGVDTGRPTLQSRVGYRWTIRERVAAVGVSGHWGTEDLSHDFHVPGLEFTSWSANIDLQTPLPGPLTFRTEGWTGQNLDDYLGAIDQGINLSLRRSIRASGGWAAVEAVPGEGMTMSVGVGVDDPDDRDLDVDGRARNRVAWANVFVDLTSHLQMAAELSHFETRYTTLPTGSALRLQTAVMLSF